MKKLILLTILFVAYQNANSQCTTTNATSCVCLNGTESNCDLLPDITISWFALQNYSGGPNEFSQSGNGADNGRLKVSGSTPNIGRGPLNIVGQWDSASVTWSRFICGNDTVIAPNSGFNCPNGYPIPKQLPYQRIYHKNGNTMTSYLRPTGPVNYVGGGSLYNDDWGRFTLRIQKPSEPNPLNWDIVGEGHKLGFCLMDYYECSGAPNHCKDDNTIYNQGTTYTNSNFPNWGLGGGNYSCDPYSQGISSGFTDVYSESLGGMWINIPPETCNGQYWIVYEVDPNNYFLEENENNNYTAIPFTLTQQSSSGNPIIKIIPDKSGGLCSGETLKLTATAGTSYLWSNGATTQSINVMSGTYSVTVTNYCGTGSATYTVPPAHQTPTAPIALSDTVCFGYATTLTASGANLTWYDNVGNEVGYGNSFVTPILTANTNYSVIDKINYPGYISNVGKLDMAGGGGYSNSSTNYLQFDVFRPITIKSVKVFAAGAGNRKIVLADEIGIYKQGVIANVPDGESRVTLNFEVAPGKNYSLRALGNINLYRNNAGVSYPFVMQDTLSITGTTAGTNYYYYFYDWEIEMGATSCESPQTSVTAFVETCTGIDDSWDLSNNYKIYPNPSNGKFTLDMIIPGSGDINIVIRDLVGREIYTKQLTDVSGKNSYHIDLNEASKGIYLLDIKIGAKNYFKKLILD